MNSNEYWQQFINCGSVDSYLKYREEKNKINGKRRPFSVFFSDLITKIRCSLFQERHIFQFFRPEQFCKFSASVYCKLVKSLSVFIDSFYGDLFFRNADQEITEIRIGRVAFWTVNRNPIHRGDLQCRIFSLIP